MDGSIELEVPKSLVWENLKSAMHPPDAKALRETGLSVYGRLLRSKSDRFPRVSRVLCPRFIARMAGAKAK